MSINELIIFNNETDLKIENILKLKNELKLNFMQKNIFQQTIASEDFLGKINIPNNELNKSNQNLLNFRKNSFYFAFLLFGHLIYSIGYTIKLKRMNIPIINSKYTWISFLFSFYIFNSIANNKTNEKLNEIFENIIIESTINNEENNEENKQSKKDLLSAQLSFYKFHKNKQ